MHKLLSGSLLIFVLFIFGGCGGGSSSSPTALTTSTEKFLDSAVSGMDYNCSSGNSGTTNASGEFTCDIGDSVSFSIAGISLGTVDANATITPLDLFPANEEAGINLAQLLQTLDSDANASNGIVLDANLLSRLNGQTFDFTANTFETTLALLLGVPLVDNVTASQHLNITLLSLRRATLFIPNNAPSITDNNISITMSEYTTTLTNLLANVTDADGDTLTVASVTQLDGNTTLPTGYTQLNENLTIDFTSKYLSKKNTEIRTVFA